MTQPAYPGFPPTPPPTPPTPQYPAQPSYPVAPGQLPQYPQQQYPPQYPVQPQYGPPPMPGYPPVQLAPQQPRAQGSLDEFFNQPSAGGGKSLTFPVVGTRYVGIVTRAITSADIQQQTTPPANGSVPQFYKDGRPKFVMRVPLQMQPSQAYPDGLATWFVKGQARDELVRAMAEANAPAGPPEAGSIIDITFVGERPVPGMNPAKQVKVVYTRPQGAAPAVQPPAPAPEQQAPQQLAPGVPYPAAPTAQPGVAPVAYQQPPAAPAQQQFAPPPPAAAPESSAPPAAQSPQPPADLSAEQQELLKQLTGAQQSG